jgi:magnesium transporter
MDTYGNVIANNMNIVMRTLTIVAIVLAIPTIVFSFYGMNVEQLPLIMSPLFPLALSVVAVTVAIVIMQRMRPFR